MRKNILFFCIAISAFVSISAQQSIRDARKQSWQSLVYRIPADTAEKYISNYIIFPDHYLEESPFAVWWSDSLKHVELPVGNYLVIAVKENDLVAEYYCQSKLKVLPLNNRHRVQLEVKDGTGDYPANARIWVNKKEIKFDKGTQSYTIRNKKPDEAILKITVPGDTLFMELSAMENMHKNEWQQWWANMSYTKAGKIITWPVRTIKSMVTRPFRYGARKRKKIKYFNNGYAVFNKPKYLPKDTVKFKAYILDKKRKQYKKELNVFLEYSVSGRYVSKNIATVKPLTPGSFIHEFIIGDSLDSDKTYAVVFKTGKGTVMMRSSFRIEDYLLDEMASYSFRYEKENYYRQDTLRFYASAKDANGLGVMDGRVNFYLLTERINKMYKEKEFIPDTLWQGEKALTIEGDTKFEVIAERFPSTDLSIKALAIFRNSNNETEEKELEIEFTNEGRIIKVEQDGAYVSAQYIENGKEKNAIGWLTLSDDQKPAKIYFPYRKKIDPFVSQYKFKIEDSAGKLIVRSEWEPEQYAPSFSRIQQKDTTGFSLYNPNKIPVHYIVFNGQKIISKGRDSSEFINWKKILPKKKMYNVEWNYIWGGEERKGNSIIAFLDKVLNTKIENAQTVFPGQTDTIKVSIKDYKGNPAANVNLSAVSYSSQFKDAINVAEPPYLQKFKVRRRIFFDDYELYDAGFTKRVALGDHQQWRNKLGLDTMAYYQLLFPKENFTIISGLINEFTPQLAVHIAKKGIPQEIYMLYINRQFAWYNGVTDRSNYAFPVVPGYTQVGIRLKDKFVEIDSIYLQPFYKHDISFDIDQLPAKKIIEERPGFYTALERNQIERSVWQLQNDSRTNYGYVWQGNRVVYLGGNNVHRVGPFSAGDSLQFYKPGSFDFKFPFEPGYEYRLTPKMARLEKKNIFPAIEKIMLPKVDKTTWILGDTLRDAPAISYSMPDRKPYLLANDNAYFSGTRNGFGSLKIELPKDSVFAYGILYRQGEDTSISRIRNYDIGNFYSVLPGRYNLVLVTRGFSFLEVKDIDISSNGTLCLRFIKPLYETGNSYFHQLVRQNDERSKKEMADYFEKERQNGKLEILPQSLPLPKGNGFITGRVTDKKGKSPIPGAAVMIKGYNVGVSTGSDGSFSLQNIRQGSYILMISSVGYEMQEVKVEVTDNKVVDIDVQLLMGASNLEEVVVIGYGSAKKKSFTGSISVVKNEEVISSLQGKVAGVNISGESDGNNSIQIRGISSFSNNAKPVYVVNGVVMDELPAGFDMNNVQVSVLTGETAIGLYGARAANGAILIATADFMPKTVRDKFRDYAFWQPNLFTDENGEVRFTVTYPDNITGWQTYVVGMDKKRRFTKARSFTKSFKPLLARLSTPQFLIEGDSSSFVGKVINYTKADFSLATNFSIDDKTVNASVKELKANSSIVDALNVFVNNNDTLTAQYNITTSAGYSDGELRKIPVFRKGVEEAKGSFWILDKDSSFSFIPDKNAGDIFLYAQNNTLDVLLDELKQLKEYPFFCMEQTASKLTGLAMEKKIMQELKQPFKAEKELQQLIEKLQKGQLFDGGWGWWQGGDANLTITNYVIQTLLPMRNEVLVETSVRNGLLFLQNRLPSLKKADLLNSLFTLSEAGHSMDYQSYLNKLEFDSLTIHQQWQVVKIKQQQKSGYDKELNKLMDNKIETMLGGLHWGDNSYYWDRNDMATTVLSFKVLEKEERYQPLLKQIIQFFLERRESGRWRNTVESASTLAAILPVILQQNNKFTSTAQLSIKADKIISVEKFPFTQKISNTQTPLDIKRSGGGLVYLTAVQKTFNSNPEPVTDKFIIDTWYERSGTNVTSLTAGEKITMKVSVNALKDAEYVQIEIPIPAGCTYAVKKQDNWKMHKEYLKDKMILFVEKMEKGKYSYEIELEPRYTGNYYLNPARAELMYFPTYYGRNNIKKLTIRK